MKNIKILGIITVAFLLILVLGISLFAFFGIFTGRIPEGRLPENEIVIEENHSETEAESKITALIKTEKGDIKIALSDSAAAEKFAQLCSSGVFDSASFEILAEDMFIQTEICGEAFEAEETSLPAEKGAVGFVTENGKAYPSIVIITGEDMAYDFEGKVLVFGKAVSGMENALTISAGENSGYTGGFAANEPVFITGIEIENPAETNG